jgi:hypothetical protein
MARYDFCLSDEEFGELTPGEFQALCKRRNVRVKYERFANAQTAAAVYNVNRHSVDDPVVTAFDFVRTTEESEKKERLMTAKRFVRDALGGFPMSTTREKFLEVRGKVISDLKTSGYEDAEQIVDGQFPSLKSKEDE